MPDTNNGLYTAQFWRDRAEQARLMAFQMTDIAPKAVMLMIVEKYEVIGQMVEARERPKKA